MVILDLKFATLLKKSYRYSISAFKGIPAPAIISHLLDVVDLKHIAPKSPLSCLFSISIRVFHFFTIFKIQNAWAVRWGFG